MSSTLKCNMGLLFIIPILISLFGIVGIWSVYGIAEQYNLHNATDQFPFIGECGDKPPASYLFALVCNICCILAWIFEGLRFKNNQTCYKDKEALNISSLVVGILCFLGLAINGNVPASSFFVVHVIGGNLASFFSQLYLWINVWLIRKRILRKVGICFCITYTILLFVYPGFIATGSLNVAAILEWTLRTFFFLVYPVFVIDFAKMNYSLQ